MILFFFEMLLLGVGVGVANGALGIGGGVLMVPALLEFVPGMKPHTAEGTSLFIIIFVAAVNAWRQNRGKEVQWTYAGLLAAGSIAGGVGGAWVTRYLSGKTLEWIFVGLLALMGLRFLLSQPRQVFKGKGWERGALAVGIGLAAGVTSGMTGVGGGLILVPLVLLVGISTNKDVTRLSNLVMIGTSAAGAAVHLLAAKETDLSWTVGQVSLGVAPWIFAGAVVGSPLGRWLNRRLTYKWRKVVLVVLIGIIAARMVWRALS